jgi:hypothetical protein
LFENAPVVKQYAKSTTVRFDKTVLSDGIQLHVPFIVQKEVREGETDAATRKHNNDLKSRSPEELEKQLHPSTANPHGLFHMEAACRLTPEHPAFTNAIGLDPGVVNLVTTTAPLKITNASFYKQTYGVKVYDPSEILPNAHAHMSMNQSGGKHSRRTRHNMIPTTIETHQDTMKTHAPKCASADLETFVHNLAAYLPCAEELRKFYGTRSRRALKLTRASNARARMRSIVQEICPDPRTVIVFGANFFGWNSTPKGTVAGPPAVKAIRRALAKCRVVVLADEYMSSQRHLKCGAQMADHPMDKREKWCSTCDCAVDRDMNAALNILEIWREFIRSRNRPAHLRREPHDVI